MRLIRTVLIEDETMFRQLIQTTLGRIKELRVIGEFGLGKPGLHLCLTEKPHLLVVDLRLPDIDGLEVVRQVLSGSPQTKILVITAHPSARLPLQLAALGVHGYIDKGEPIDYLLSACDTIRRGGMFFATHVRASPTSAPRSSSVSANAVTNPLTRREQEVIRLVASGLMSKEIADRLNLSPRTVEKHRENIMHKLGIHDVARLTRWCLDAGLVGT